MEGKSTDKDGAASPRSYSYGDEDVFDFPGVEDEADANGPVSRDAHLALKEAFKTVKKWLLDAKVQNAELQLKLQQIREKKLGPHSRVYQERDELHSHLQKSYQAFSEKYGENEQLKKTIQELKEALRLSQETNAQGEGSAQPSSTSEAGRKSEKEKYTTLIEELKIMGLEAIEENEQLFIILIDRDNLKKWIEESSDGTVTVVFKGSASEDKDTKTEGVSTLHEGHEQTEGKRKRLEAEVILLKRTIQDQAEELSRFYTVFKQAMEENLRNKEKKQQAEGRNIEQGLPTWTLNPAAASGATSQRTTSHTSTALQEKAETMLASVKEKVTEIKQVKEHLDKQNKSLRTLIDLTEKTTADFSQLVGARKPREVPDPPGGRIPSQGMEMGASFSEGQRSREGNFERVFSDDAPLSMPVQETEKHRLSSGADEEISNEAMYNLRLTGGEGALAPSSAVFSKRVEGRAVPMTTPISENTWTGESDIEVIEEEEDFVGASASRGKFCPVCERFFPASYDQNEFELHVQQHFEDDA